MYKNRKVLLIAAVVLLIAGVFAVSAIIDMKHLIFVPDPVDYTQYVVESGDTIWDIAHMSDGYSKVDTREIVQDIIEYSNCSDMIYPGDIIYIPNYYIEER